MGGTNTTTSRLGTCFSVSILPDALRGMHVEWELPIILECVYAYYINRLDLVDCVVHHPLFHCFYPDTIGEPLAE